MLLALYKRKVPSVANCSHVIPVTSMKAAPVEAREGKEGSHNELKMPHFKIASQEMFHGSSNNSYIGLLCRDHNTSYTYYELKEIRKRNDDQLVHYLA